MGTPTYSLNPSNATSDPSDVNAPAANTSAVVTYAAVAGVSHVVSSVVWSYNAAPTGGNLKIEDGAGNTIFTTDITSQGPGFIQFTPAKRGTVNTALIVTLAAGGAAVTGKLSVVGHWTA